MALLLRVDAVSLELRPEIGGCIGAFRIERRGGSFDLMRPFGRSPGELSDALYSAMFPMLPFANCIRDNCFTFEGRRYEVASNMAGARLNFHGSGWRSPWGSIRERGRGRPCAGRRPGKPGLLLFGSAAFRH